MKARQVRLRAVSRLIETHPVGSQDALLELLKSEGFSLTQATLSRDLKSLQVGKRPDPKEGSVYYLPGETERSDAKRDHILDFVHGYISIEWSGNIVVIKTYSGHAGAVAIAVDDLALEDVLGTVAGENVVFVCLREGVSGEDFMAVMKHNIPTLEA
jgi:transcriptional regulator of arginine metabolism